MGLPLGPFTGHTHSVTSVGFSPDGQRIVSGSHDRTIRAWNATTGDVWSIEGQGQNLDAGTLPLEDHRPVQAEGTMGPWMSKSDGLFPFPPF